MINIDPKSWHARLYLWYLRSRHGRLQARGLQGTYLCPYMRTLLLWIPLWIAVGIPLIGTLWILYHLLWGDGDWRFRPRWIWLGAIIGAPLLIPAAQFPGFAWEVGQVYLFLSFAIVVAGLALLMIFGFMYWWLDADGKATSYREMHRTGRVVVTIMRPVAIPTYGFARLLYKYYQTFHTKVCPRVQFMEPEAWEEE